MLKQTKNIPAKNPMIISINFNIFLKAKPIAYPARPEPANGIMFDNKTVRASSSIK